jgi:hypothetical protein
MTPENAEQLEQLTAYLDGELAPDDRAEIERLLDSDAEARRLLDELRETSELVAALPRGRAPEDLARQVNARLERQALLGDAPVTAAPARVGWSWANRLAMVAAVVLVCTVAWMGWPQFEDQAAPVMTLAEKDVDLGETAVERMAMGLDVEDERYAQPARAAEKLRAPASRGRGGAFESVGKPVPTRGVESETSLFDESGSAGMRFAASKAEAAWKIERPAETVSIERRLAENTLNVTDLQQAGMSKWSNQMVVHARRPSEAAGLASFIREDMARNDIPHLATADGTETIAPEASFYSFNAVDPHKRARAVLGEAVEPASAEPATETPTVVVHVPRKQAERFIASFQNYAEGNIVDASWTFNGQPVSQEVVASEVAPQLVASDIRRGFRSEKGGPVEDGEDGAEADFDEEEKAETDDAAQRKPAEQADADGAPSQPAARHSARRRAAGMELKREQRDDDEADGVAEDRKKQAGSAQPEDAEETPDSPPPKAAPVTRTGGRGGRSRGAGSKPIAPTENTGGRTTSGSVSAGLRFESAASRPASSVAGDSGFVTLAIALCYDAGDPATSAPPAIAKRRRMAPTTRTAPTAEFVGPPAPESQPTTRESTGG